MNVTASAISYGTPLRLTSPGASIASEQIIPMPPLKKSINLIAEGLSGSGFRQWSGAPTKGILAASGY